MDLGFLIPCDCYCSLPHDAMGWSAVCDCVCFCIMLTYSLETVQNRTKEMAYGIQPHAQSCLGSYPGFPRIRVFEVRVIAL